MREVVFLVSLVIGTLTSPLVCAGNWGSNWGRMYWGDDPISVPGAPTITSIEESDGKLIVRFTPGIDGFSVVTSYTANCGAVTASGTDSPVIVSNLNDATQYQCTVIAINDVGVSLSSVAVAATTLEEAISSGLNIILIKAALDAKGS